MIALGAQKKKAFEKLSSPADPKFERQQPKDEKDILPGKRLLKDFLARVSGQSAGAHVQLQEYHQQEQQIDQQQPEQGQRRDININQGLQALEDKDVIDFEKWKQDFCQGIKNNYWSDPPYLRGFTPLQHKYMRKSGKFPYHTGNECQAGIAFWFRLTLVHNLYGFTQHAMPKIIEHITQFQDGINLDAPHRGLAVRTITARGKAQQVGFYHAVLPYKA